MSLRYKFDKLNENDPEKKESQGSTDIERFDAPANVRNLCLVPLSGKMLFLNYSYLMSGEYSPDDGTITLTFTTHTVTLKGKNLENLFVDFVNHMPKIVSCVDERYAGTKGENETIVTELITTKEK